MNGLVFRAADQRMLSRKYDGFGIPLEKSKTKPTVIGIPNSSRETPEEFAYAFLADLSDEDLKKYYDDVSSQRYIPNLLVSWVFMSIFDLLTACCYIEMRKRYRSYVFKRNCTYVSVAIYTLSLTVNVTISVLSLTISVAMSTLSLTVRVAISILSLNIDVVNPIFFINCKCCHFYIVVLTVSVAISIYVV